MFRFMKGWRTKIGSTLLGISTVVAQLDQTVVPHWLPPIGQGLGLILTAIGIRYGNDPEK